LQRHRWPRGAASAWTVATMRSRPPWPGRGLRAAGRAGIGTVWQDSVPIQDISDTVDSKSAQAAETVYWHVIAPQSAAA
jgi:hypothetical protein